ncbi:MAG: heme-binding protein [Candidatus Sumerlaeaceae bacterium]|nr:heme-binding protein [Candidatus Sumerlaeaceae bacterium]
MAATRLIRNRQGALAVVAALFSVFMGRPAMGQEEAKYSVVKKDGAFEVRQYEARVVAETFVEGDFASAGNSAFNRLFGYISGKNKGKQKVAMTAPVTQETSDPSAGSKEGEKIAMTAPVTQETSGGKFRVTFILPASFTMANAPEPTDPDVKLKSEPARKAAVVKYSGSWSQKLYDRKLAELKDWMTTSSLVADGNPVWARYNPPFSIPVFRRNEIIIPIKDSAVNKPGQ